MEPQAGAQRVLALDMHRVGAFKLGDFVLASGRRSVYYIDLRPAFREFGFRQIVAGLMLRKIIEDHIPYEDAIPYPELIADVPNAATPLATTLADRLSVNLVSPQVKEKDHGVNEPVQGIYQPGQTALLVDDLITTAGSKLKAIELLRSVGIEVQDVLVVVDRTQGGKEGLAEAGCRLHSLIELPVLLSIFLAEGLLPQADYNRSIRALEESRQGI